MPAGKLVDQGVLHGARIFDKRAAAGISSAGISSAGIPSAHAAAASVAAARPGLRDHATAQR